MTRPPRRTPTRVLGVSTSCPTTRPIPQSALGPGAQRAGLLRRAGRAKPLLGHRRHLPVGVPDHLGRGRPARRAADHRPQHPARRRRDRGRQRREQQGHAPHLLAPPRRPRRRLLAVRPERRSASGTRRRGGCCCATTTRPGRCPRRPSRTAARSRSAASASSWRGTAPTTRRTTSSSTCPDHDTLMLVDIVNPGWAPVYQRNLTEDVPGYIEAPANALAYPWKHFIGGHMGRLGTRDDIVVAPAVHGRHRRQLTRRRWTRSTRRRTSSSTARTCWAAVKGYLDAGHRGRRRAGDREVHRRARRRRRLHRQHDVPCHAIDPPRPRLRLAGSPLIGKETP